ncbi:MAG: hypothetical protein ACKVOJ_13950 [Sphingomonadaceae bacterium]
MSEYPSYLLLIVNAVSVTASIVTLIGVMMMQRERQGDHNPQD